MKNLNHLLFLGFLLILFTKLASAQTNSTHILPGNDVAVLSKPKTNGLKPGFVHHYDKMNNVVTSHDTVKYVLVVDATMHLETNETEEILAPDTVSNKVQRKLEVATALHAALMRNDVLFNYNEFLLTDAAKYLLDKASLVMLQYPDAVFEIGGHADSRGLFHDNMILTQKRVAAAIEYLVSKGVSINQLVPVAYSESILKNVCDSDSFCSEEVHASNRRIEIKLLSVGK